MMSHMMSPMFFSGTSIVASTSCDSDTSAAPTRLLDVAAFRARMPVHGFAVGHARHCRRRLDPVLAPQLFQSDVQMHIAEAGDDQLMRVLVSLDVQRGVLFAESRQPTRDLFLVAPCLRCDGQAVSRTGQVEWRERPTVTYSERVAGQRVGSEEH